MSEQSSTVTTDISMQDVRLVAGEGKLTARQVLDSVNIILRQRAERGARAQTAPDTYRETVRKVAAAREGRLAQCRGALECIAAWRKVNTQGEYEHALRDIIRSITDCAAAALEASALPSTSQDAPAQQQLDPRPSLDAAHKEENEKWKEAEKAAEPWSDRSWQAGRVSGLALALQIYDQAHIAADVRAFEASALPSTECPAPAPSKAIGE